MILDRIDNWRLYAAADSLLGRGFRWLAEEFDPATPDGRIDLEGDDLFALVQGYETRTPENCRFEAHNVYTDIQYVYEGAEGMGWAPRGELTVTEPYSTERDVAFFATPENPTIALVRKGEFALFHPNDAHQPGLALPGIPTVRKVVIKVRL